MSIFDKINDIIKELLDQLKPTQEQDWKLKIGADILKDAEAQTARPKEFTCAVKLDPRDKDKAPELHACANKVDPSDKGKAPELHACANKVDPSDKGKAPELHACADKVDPSDKGRDAIKVKPRDLDKDTVKFTCAAKVDPSDKGRGAVAYACAAKIDRGDRDNGAELHACNSVVNPSDTRVTRLLNDAVATVGTSNGNALTGASQGSSLLASMTVPDREASNVPASTKLVASEVQLNSGHGLVVDNGSKSSSKTI